MPKRSRKLLPGLAAFAVAAALAGGPVPASADTDGVVRFATLPKDGPGFPEGIAADAAGNIYVSTFDSTANAVHVFAPDGRLQTSLSLPAGSAALGLEFDAAGALYVADFANGNVLQYTPPFNAGSLPARTFAVCGGRDAGCGLNALAFDAEGSLYVSDSFGGNVFMIELPGGAVSTFVADELLKPGSHGFPPFGANGLAFDAAGNLYVANTADDRILKVDVETKEVTTFAESINGADGIAFDGAGRLWVAANQGDEVVALNEQGRVVERRGSFDGIDRVGAPRGLLFPASLVISRDSLYVTNLALPLTNDAPGDEPEEDVTTFTVSRLPLGPRR